MTPERMKELREFIDEHVQYRGGYSLFEDNLEECLDEIEHAPAWKPRPDRAGRWAIEREIIPGVYERWFEDIIVTNHCLVRPGTRWYGPIPIPERPENEGA